MRSFMSDPGSTARETSQSNLPMSDSARPEIIRRWTHPELPRKEYRFPLMGFHQNHAATRTGHCYRNTREARSRANVHQPNRP